MTDQETISEIENNSEDYKIPIGSIAIGPMGEVYETGEKESIPKGEELKIVSKDIKGSVGLETQFNDDMFLNEYGEQIDRKYLKYGDVFYIKDEENGELIPYKYYGEGTELLGTEGRIKVSRQSNKNISKTILPRFERRSDSSITKDIIYSPSNIPYDITFEIIKLSSEEARKRIFPEKERPVYIFADSFSKYLQEPPPNYEELRSVYTFAADEILKEIFGKNNANALMTSLSDEQVQDISKKLKL